jgi:integration host factor subunit beta
MTNALQQGEGIEIRGFGSFTVRDYKAYEGRNPRTGDTVHVRPKRLAFFKVGKELRERVNQGRLKATGSTPAVSPEPPTPNLSQSE